MEAAEAEAAIIVIVVIFLFLGNLARPPTKSTKSTQS
jgi:hypothetical protein